MKLYNDDGDEDSVSWPLVQACAVLTARRQDIPQPSGSSTPLDRTSTGIISNKPRKVGLLAFTSAASEATGLSVMALAKRESARRGLYSRFFRGPVLGPDTEEPQVPEVVQRSPPFRPGLSDPTPSVSVMEKRKGKKRKSREEDEEVGMAQKKRKPKREKRRLGKEAKKGEAYERRSHDEVGAGLMEELIALEGSVKDGDTAGYSRKKDRKKKRKRDESDDTVYHRSSWVLE